MMMGDGLGEGTARYDTIVDEGRVERNQGIRGGD